MFFLFSKIPVNSHNWTQMQIQTKRAVSACYLSIQWFQLQPLLELLHETLGMVHNQRSFAEPEAIKTQKKHTPQLSSQKNSCKHELHKLKFIKITSNKTKKGAIINACARLSNKAGARFCIWNQNFKCINTRKRWSHARARTHTQSSVQTNRFRYLEGPMANELSCPTHYLSHQNNLKTSLLWLNDLEPYAYFIYC